MPARNTLTRLLLALIGTRVQGVVEPRARSQRVLPDLEPAFCFTMMSWLMEALLSFHPTASLNARR
jgi:hypothetical protein